MFEVIVIEDPAAAAVSLEPIRARLLAELARPGSTTTLAFKLGMPRGFRGWEGDGGTGSSSAAHRSGGPEAAAVGAAGQA
jgi:hypothetical protein